MEPSSPGEGSKIRKSTRRNPPPLPESIKDLETGSMPKVNKYSTPCGCVHKTDKHRYLQKCRARLVVCGNQQAKGDLPTRATTLASTAFRTLAYATGFTRKGKVHRLRKALYGLRRSPLLPHKNHKGRGENKGTDPRDAEQNIRRISLENRNGSRGYMC
jgi:hypothetical protein